MNKAIRNHVRIREYANTRIREYVIREYVIRVDVIRVYVIRVYAIRVYTYAYMESRIRFCTEAIG